jgi:stage II sporulation protein D
MISGTDLTRKLHPTQDLRNFSGRKSIRLNCRGFSERNRQNPELGRPVLLASLVSQTGLIALADERFAGELKVVSAEDRSESCDVIHITNMEDYIATLLAKEMNASWHLEALKAQAVAARTYAYQKILANEESFYHLENSERHQVSGTFFDATERTLEATRATRGLILKTQSGQITEAFFHAKCGGRTLVPEHVWANSVEGYRAVVDPYCKGRGNLNSWKAEISQARFIAFLNWARERQHIKVKKPIAASTQLFLIADQADQSQLQVFVEGEIHSFNKSLLRRYFGRVEFASNNFRATWTGKTLYVSGEGLGHGVGMCQIGALGMADQGKNFREILQHFYPGHRIDKIY